MKSINQFSPPNLQQGVTMIEVLVTILILAIGFLGLASLQSVGLSYNQGAFFRTQATILAQDIEDRIRSNPDEKTGIFATAIDTSDSTKLPGPWKDCTSNTCTITELATFDVLDWCTGFSDCAAATPTTAALPNSNATITRNAAGVFTVTITWTEKTDTKNPNNVKTLMVSFL